MREDLEETLTKVSNAYISALKMLFKERFSALYPNCSLWEIYLSRPHFVVSYKQDNGLRHIERISSEDWDFWGVVENYKDEGGNIECENTPKAKQLFEGIDHELFRDKTATISYKDMDYWTCPF